MSWNDNGIIILGLFAAVGVFGIILIVKILSLRRIVPADMVHVVQISKNTTSYGKNSKMEMFIMNDQIASDFGGQGKGFAGIEFRYKA